MNTDFICIGSINKYYDKMKKIHNIAAKYRPQYKILIPVKIGDDKYSSLERANMTVNWIKMGEGYSQVLVFNDERSEIRPEPNGGLGFHTFAELLLLIGQGKTIYFYNKPHYSVKCIAEQLPGEFDKTIYKLDFDLINLWGDKEEQ